jgi:uncharacterized protein YbjT (DUF2867 family)
MQTGKDLILVTGATGKQGGAVAHELLAAGHKVRAMTRKPDGPEAKELQKRGAEVIGGDLDDAGSLERAMKGVWGLFSLQNTWEAGVEKEEEQGLRLTDVARTAGIQHLVYASVGSAHRKTGIPHFENKARIEDRVRSLGFPSHVILRPAFFMENFAGPWFLPGLEQGQLVMAVKPETTLQMIAVTDIGKYGRWAFENHQALNRREIDLAGDQLTLPKAAEVLSRAMGRDVTFVQAPIEEVRKYSADYAMMLEWFDRVGYNADIERNARESGIAPTSLATWAQAVRWTTAPASR